jgi:hypothetical protein
MGHGTIYIGNGKIVGVDVGNGRYIGTYTEAGGRIKGIIQMTTGQAGVLVTGAQLPPGSKLSLSIDWPADFANGNAQTVSVGGLPVQVTFEKVGDA